MMRKTRAASGAGFRDRRPREDASAAPAEAESLGPRGARSRPGSLDPLDPASEYESPDGPVFSRSRRSPGGARALPFRSSSGGGSDESAGDRQAGARRPARSLKARALEYLSRREYSRIELARKLAPFADETDSLDGLIDSLEKEGWLSDARFVESVVHRRAARQGANRIVSELRRHAVSDTLVEAASAQLRETEFARAQAVWQKKFGQLPETPAERMKQARFLAMRGFSSAVIALILKGDEDGCGD